VLEAYERLIHDAMTGSDLVHTAEGIERLWRCHSSDRESSPGPLLPAGVVGPEEMNQLIAPQAGGCRSSEAGALRPMTGPEPSLARPGRAGRADRAGHPGAAGRANDHRAALLGTAGRRSRSLPIFPSGLRRLTCTPISPCWSPPPPSPCCDRPQRRRVHPGGQGGRPRIGGRQALTVSLTSSAANLLPFLVRRWSAAA